MEKLAGRRHQGFQEVSYNWGTPIAGWFTNSRTGQPHKSTSSNKQKQEFKWNREGKIDKGGGGGSIRSTVVYEELCVTQMPV